MQKRHFLYCVVCIVGGCAKAPSPAPRSAPPPASDPTPAQKAAGATPASQVDARTRAARPHVARAPKKAAELIARGKSLQAKQGKKGAKDAVALYEAALRADPFAAEALWELGWSHQVLQQWDAALAAWSHLARLNPDYPELETYYPVLKMRYDAARALANLPATGEMPPPELTPRAGPRLRIKAVGDIQMGRGWPEEHAALPENQGKPLFAQVRSTLRNADITFGNLETVLADSGESSKCRQGASACYAFRAPTRFTQALVDAGFDVLSIANNHTGDFGPQGRKATMAALDTAGLLHSGPVDDIASWEVKGLRIALVAFATGAGLYRLQDIDTARRVVAALDREHDLVFVSFHGGAEGRSAQHVPKATEMFYGENRGNVYAFAHAMVDTGADVVLGHGPHVLRGMEIYRGRFIAYSLGNFSAWTGFNLAGPLGKTAIVDLHIAPNGVALKAALTPIHIEQPGVPRPDPQRRAIRIIRRLSAADLGDPLFDRNGKWVRPDGSS